MPTTEQSVNELWRAFLAQPAAQYALRLQYINPGPTCSSVCPPPAIWCLTTALVERPLSLRIRVPRRRGQKSFWGWACSVLSNVLCRARVRSFERIPDRAFSVPAYSHYTVPFLRFKTAAIFHSATNCCFVFEQNRTRKMKITTTGLCVANSIKGILH